MIDNKPTGRQWASLTIATFVAVIAGCAQGQPVKTVTCVPFWKVQVAGGFWSARLDANRKTTIPASFKFCESTKRIDNFEIAAKQKKGKFTGAHFNDSDVYKIIEGAAYMLKANPDAKLEKYVDGVIAKFAAAQQSDGYLDTYFTIARRDQRFKHIQHSPRHELYCMGHLIEAGAAHHEVTGKKNLLTVATKLADHIDSVFGPDKRHEVPEHQQLESALIRLYRATGEKRYLKLGQFFIDQRGAPGRRKRPAPYSQDHMPVRKQSEVVGHAVRAMYNCMGMADLYMETGDAELLAACRRLWENTTHRKMYITGGVGATGRGEAFGKEYELPNASAYAETCAAIGLVFFAHRMWRVEPDGEYIDVLERALYNGMLGGVSLAGDEFFYVNRLARRRVVRQHVSARIGRRENGRRRSHADTADQIPVGRRGQNHRQARQARRVHREGAHTLLDVRQPRGRGPVSLFGQRRPGYRTPGKRERSENENRQGIRVDQAEVDPRRYDLADPAHAGAASSGTREGDRRHRARGAGTGAPGLLRRGQG